MDCKILPFTLKISYHCGGAGRANIKDLFAGNEYSLVAGFHKKFRPRVQREPGWPKNIPTVINDFVNLGTTMCPQCFISLFISRNVYCTWTGDGISCFAPQVDTGL